MRTIAITDTAISQFVCYVAHRCANTDQRPAWVEDYWGPRNTALDVSPDPHGEGRENGGFDAAFAKLLWHLFMLTKPRAPWSHAFCWH